MKKDCGVFLLCLGLFFNPIFCNDRTHSGEILEDFKDFDEAECSDSLRSCVRGHPLIFMVGFALFSFLVIYYNHPRFKKKLSKIMGIEVKEKNSSELPATNIASSTT